jgi:hypothetical protein
MTKKLERISRPSRRPSNFQARSFVEGFFSRQLFFPFALIAPLFLLPLLGHAAPTQEGKQDLLAQADSVLKQMSEITGLPIKASLQKQIIGRSEVQKYLTRNLHEEMTPQEIHVQEATLRAFGLVSRDFDLEKFLIAFYTEQAAGFYDTRHKTMFIADWTPPEMQHLVLAHELTHALQDQNFDIDKFLHAHRDNDDASNARQAILEGYATAAMMQQMVGDVPIGSLPALEPLMAQVIHQQYEEFPAFSKAPFFFRLEALFPYIEGMGFMQRGLQQGGWQILDSLFTNPPQTTKEIFQPAVYFDKQPLPAISLGRPAQLAKIAGLQFLTDNTMGELGYHALLGQFISEAEAKSVGDSWLADRYLLYENAPQYTLVARARWTSSETALAFFRDYHTILARKYPELAPENKLMQSSSTGTEDAPRTEHSQSHESGTTEDLFIGSASNGQVVLLRKGDECRWAEGVPANLTSSMLVFLRSL